MNILITGACGHIGSYLIENIDKIEKVKNVYLIDSLFEEKTHSLYNLNNSKFFFFYKIDLCKKDILNKFKNIDIIIHLASITNAAKSFEIKKQMYKNNLSSFNNVVKYCIKNKTKLLHISSTSIYGKTKGIVDESCEKKYLKPQSPYAEIKLIEEKILKKKSKKLKYITFRFGTIVGPSKGMRFHTAVNSFCFNVCIGEKISVYETAMNQYRPYLSIRDSFKVFKHCIEKNFFTNQIYNAISNNYTVRQILDKIKKIKKKIKIKYVKSPIMNQLSYHVDDKKLRKEGLFLNSNIDFDIEKTLKLFKNIL